LFQSDSLPFDHQYDFNFEFDERNYTMSDGANINCLFIPSDSSKGIILYFHGNSDNLVRWGEIAHFFNQYNFDVLIYDYRGFGKSTGKRNLDNLFSDAMVLYNDLLKTYDDDEIIVYGRSLGSGIASWLASKTNPKMLILETPFYSLDDINPFPYLLLPFEFLSNYAFPNYEYLKSVKAPIRIFHGTDDSVVPYTSGKRLYESVKSDKDIQFISIVGGKHKNLADFKKFEEEIAFILNPRNKN